MAAVLSAVNVIVSLNVLLVLVKACAKYTSKITITAPTGSADAKRLMGIMRLGAKAGQELTITVEGPDEEKEAAELQAFFAENV